MLKLMNMNRKILVIGSAGQIGSELVPALRKEYGGKNVIATGRRTPLPEAIKKSGPVIYLDALDKNSIAKVIFEYEIDTNLNGLINVLEVARSYKIDRVIWPSSIAAFGPTTPRENTPNITVLQPTTMYGITKVAGELLAEYYYNKYNLDIRSIRLPGIISSETLPGGGTTDYAVEIFYEAIKNKKYTCFLKEDTVLPMLYMPDCNKCMIDLLEADNSKLKRRVYNLTGISFSAGEIAAEIKKHIPEFEIDYKPDFRQAIADSWPKTIDDSLAREEWGWNPSFDLASMTKDMIKVLTKRL
ncbi:putative epimerase/dehydratase [subsurface metagenome]